MVYGFPAVAVPVRGLRAAAEYSAAGPAPCLIEAPDIGLHAALNDLPPDNPLAFCVRHAAAALKLDLAGGRLTVVSQIPVASGLGSGAAVSTAVVRALASAAGRTSSPMEISQIVYEVERIHHGTPSGVDNTVIAFESPVFFRRGEEPQLVAAGAPMDLLIADSGMRSKTRDAVGGVRERRQADPQRYDGLFRKIGELAEEGRRLLEAGQAAPLGAAMNRCHGLLTNLGVSTPLLDRMADAARQAGAFGAKLTGAGLGGNVIALVDPARIPEVEAALTASGAAAVYRTNLER
ncbi:MAG: mevalonate kinase [Anaerolineales bacterium]|nr:mevalonate kinase [Anaerolineales bacterium]